MRVIVMFEKVEFGYQLRTAPKPLPLMREVDSPQGEDGGRDRYPSVKNQKIFSSSPDKKSLGHCRAY